MRKAVSLYIKKYTRNKEESKKDEEHATTAKEINAFVPKWDNQGGYGYWNCKGVCSLL